jgi:hypothetical protein
MKNKTITKTYRSAYHIIIELSQTSLIPIIILSMKWFSLLNKIQDVSEIRVLILTSERTRQFMTLFSITFCKIRKSIPRFFAPQFVPNESFCVTN